MFLRKSNDRPYFLYTNKLGKKNRSSATIKLGELAINNKSTTNPINRKKIIIMFIFRLVFSLFFAMVTVLIISKFVGVKVNRFFMAKKKSPKY